MRRVQLGKGRASDNGHLSGHLSSTLPSTPALSTRSMPKIFLVLDNHASVGPCPFPTARVTLRADGLAVLMPTWSCHLLVMATHHSCLMLSYSRHAMHAVFQVQRSMVLSSTAPPDMAWRPGYEYANWLKPTVQLMSSFEKVY